MKNRPASAIISMLCDYRCFCYFDVNFVTQVDNLAFAAVHHAVYGGSAYSVLIRMENWSQ
jgi:hypothetical protein